MEDRVTMLQNQIVDIWRRHNQGFHLLREVLPQVECKGSDPTCACLACRIAMWLEGEDIDAVARARGAE